MSSPRLALLLPVALGALALSGCVADDDDGPSTTRTRTLDPFTRVENRGSANLRLRVGERQEVRVTAGEQVIEDVRTEVRNGTLEVSIRGESHDEIIVEASVPELTEVALGGSGEIEAENIEASAFNVESEGSGEITLGGTTGFVVVTLDGSGDADLTDLEARDARVFVDGSGNVDVSAERRIAVEVDGSGDVNYHGDPIVTSQDMDGSGDLNHED